VEVSTVRQVEEPSDEICPCSWRRGLTIAWAHSRLDAGETDFGQV
jgi:hypothetical protein